RWTKIKRKKEAMGASKGALFTKLIREVTVAARPGGGDPDHNARLRSAVLAAREANMPNDTITRAIKKGTGELEGVAYEEMTYEGYGPAGVALVVEVLTDNKNRTAGDVRAIFAKAGGAMGAHGSVAFQFDRKGIVPVKKGPSEDQVVDLALGGGASGGGLRVPGSAPGSGDCGVGVVEDAGGARMRHVDHGVLAVGEGGPVEARLAALHLGLAQALDRHRPQIVAIEEVFHARN